MDAKRPVSFPLEDKHAVNDITWYEKVMTPHRKNALTWYISMYHVIDLKQTRGIKNVTLEGGKKFVDVAVYWEE